MTTIELENGKYTVRQHDDGRLTAERYHEPWRDLTGDKMIGALVSEIERLRAAPEARERKYTEVWSTRDGRTLLVDHMDEDHVRATLNMILRARRKRIELKAQLVDIQALCDAAIAEDHKWGSS